MERAIGKYDYRSDHNFAGLITLMSDVQGSYVKKIGKEADLAKKNAVKDEDTMAELAAIIANEPPAKEKATKRRKVTAKAKK